MLYLITGQNGAGKSLRAIWRMYQLHGQGLQVFTYGFRNLRVPFAKQWDDPRRWEDLPSNSALFIDEAQEIWRTRPAGKAVPPEVLALEKHRHQGIDIYLVTQSPMYLDSHIRPLIKDHEHLISFDSKSARLFRFSECQENVKSSSLRANAQFQVWPYPTEHYADYDSAEVHTPKAKAPWRQRIGKALIWASIALLVGSVVWLFIPSGKPKPKAKPASVTATDGSSAASFFGMNGGARQQKSYANAQDYLQAHMPRVPEMPWSMPAFDDRQVRTEPELYCMSSGEGRERSCTCLTEQGTRYRLDLARCERIARYGPAYNPYKQAPSPPPAASANSSTAKGEVEGLQPAAQQGAVIEYSAGSRGDVFPRSPGYTTSSYATTGPTSTL